MEDRWNLCMFLPLLIYLLKVSTFIFSFPLLLCDQYRMFLLIILHTCGPYYYPLCYTLWIIIEHPYIEYLISLDKLFCTLLLFWIWIIWLYVAVAITLYILVSIILQSPSYFYHFHTRGRVWVKLGDVDACKMHRWTLHYNPCFPIIFASYKCYITVI